MCEEAYDDRFIKEEQLICACEIFLSFSVDETASILVDLNPEQAKRLAFNILNESEQ